MTAAQRGEGDRPSSGEVADLLREYRQMIQDAGGLAQRIPPDRAADWQARKSELLDRIDASMSSHGDARGDDAGTGDGRAIGSGGDKTKRGGWSR